MIMGKISDALEKAHQTIETPKTTVSEIVDGYAASPAPAAHMRSQTAHRPLEQAAPAAIPEVVQEVKPVVRPDKPAPAKPKPQPTPSPDYLRGNLVAEFAAKSFAAEQFRMLRTNLLFPANGKSPRCILVTSALPDEGKSFVSANLAITFAQNIDKHVLLVDCDMRKPTIHTLFGYASAPGLSDHLAHRRPLQDLIMKTAYERLRILPGGNPPPNPAELLSSNRMADLIDEIRYRYDDRYIIIDSPPPQLTSETSAMARLVDAILLVVRSGSTDREMIEGVVDKLGKEKIVGIVANWVADRNFAYYGKGKYAQYGTYYQQA
jgi:exopolysaccharide/PEP-CTERM locus tyrosine autokinase